jgi:hypothetical protein
LFTKFCEGNKIENNEMGWACRTYGGRKSLTQVFGWGNLSERDHWRGPGVDGGIILKWIFGNYNVVYGLDRGGSG